MLTLNEVEEWDDVVVYSTPDGMVNVKETKAGYNVTHRYEGVTNLVLQTFKEHTSSCYAKQTAIDEANSVYNTMKGTEVLNG